MSQTAAIATGCVVLALGSVIGALRCLADHLLGSAVIYTLIAAALIGEATKAAINAL
jgi:hypothetical protein